MKYTRYDYRRKKGDKVPVIVMFLSMVLIAVLIGTALSSLFIKNKGGQSSNPGQNINQPGNNAQSQLTPSAAENNNNFRLFFIQSGYFSSKDNAAQTKDKLKAVVNPFVAEEDSHFRVFAGIFLEADYENIVKKLTEKELDKTKVVYEINTEDAEVQEICKIIDANLQILTKLTEQDVSGVKSEDIKKWIPSLPKVEESSKYFNILEDYKKYINGMPELIGKDKSEENYLYIYDLVKKVGTKKS